MAVKCVLGTDLLLLGEYKFFIVAAIANLPVVVKQACLEFEIAKTGKFTIRYK